MAINRKIILNGNYNVCSLGHESDIGLYAGQDLVKGAMIVDQKRRREYVITAQNPSVIVVRELTLSPEIYKGTAPLDSPSVIGELDEHGHFIRRKILEKHSHLTNLSLLHVF